MKDIKNNKHGLSYELDATMREGHHDMKLFGLGFLRSVSSQQHQAHTLASLLAPYAVMEAALDRVVDSKTNHSNTKLKKFWSLISKDVQKTAALKHDVAFLGNNELELVAAAKYVAAIQKASCNRYKDDPSSEGDLLLAHIYVRYLADLFGGSMLGRPTELALNLPTNSLAFYTPNDGPNKEMIRCNKLQFIELFYDGLNKCGMEMASERRVEIVEEAKKVFQLNADIYTEREAFIPGAMKGGVKLIGGYFRDFAGKHYNQS